MMAFRQRLACLWLGLITTLLCSVVIAANPSIQLNFCATTNTADMSAINSIYQSMGRCRDNCTSLDYSLAVLQEKNCWCSNFVPNKADQKALSKCHTPCPGYPDDYCGGSGVFGYIQLSGDLLGTASPGATNTKTSTSNDDGVSPTPGPTVHTVTVSGTVKTVTTTPSPTGNGSAELATSQKSGGLSTGATVGVAVGVVGIVVVAAIFLFMYYLKRKRRDSEEGLFTASRRGSSPRMLSTPKTGEVSENRFADAPNPAPVWDVSSANAKRRSHLMPVDPRLDPFAKGIYVRDQNKSHDSIGSLQDNQDYTRRIQEPPRVLRAVNPDPDD